MKILSLFGLIDMHSYGICIACGVALVWYLLGKEKIIKKHMTTAQLSDFFVLSIISGVIGGRILFFLSHAMSPWESLAYTWSGGYSILGTVIAVIVSNIFFMKYHQIPFWAIADTCALYAPLLHSIARVGCLTAGCCGGIAGHPTQLYSIILMALLFGILYGIRAMYGMRVGQLFSCYLIGSGLERFFVDFFRAERSWVMIGSYVISVHQAIAALLVVFGMAIFYWSTRFVYEPIQLRQAAD